MRNIRLKSKFKVPIYDVTVLIVVADDAVKAWKGYKKFLVPDPDPSFKALCCAKGSDYALFFHTGTISVDYIGHEVKHLVDFIMEFVGEDEKAKECPAYLTGYLHKKISAVLRKGNIRLSRKRKKAG